jgi:hypothetical protein
VVICLLGSVAGAFLWLRVQARWLLAGAILLAVSGVTALVLDAVVVTDREQLLALFPRLAAAAERRDVATIMAALDPDLQPLRDEAERALRQVQPTEVAITNIELALDPAAHPPRAVADLVMKVAGNVIDKTNPGTILVGARVLLLKKGGQWLIQDADVEPVRPGQR